MSGPYSIYPLVDLERFGPTGLPRSDKKQQAAGGAIPSAATDLPGGGAYDAWGSAKAAPGKRTYLVTGTLVDRTQAGLIAQVQALQARYGDQDRLYRRWADGTVDWITARLLDVKIQKEGDHVLYLPVELPFEATDRVWNGTHHGSPATWTWGDGTAGGPAPVVWGTGRAWGEAAPATLVTPGGSVWTLPNGGTAPVQAVVLALAPAPGTTGTITSLSVACPNTGCSWVYSTPWWTNTLTPQTLVVDCGARSVRLDGVPDWQHWTRTTAHTADAWLVLAPGANTLTVSWTGTAPAIAASAVYSDGKW